MNLGSIPSVSNIDVASFPEGKVCAGASGG
jgi:hypothetical protein